MTAARATATRRGITHAPAATFAAAATVTIRHVAARRHRHHENHTVHRSTSEKALGKHNQHA